MIVKNDSVAVAAVQSQCETSGTQRILFPVRWTSLQQHGAGSSTPDANSGRFVASITCWILAEMCCAPCLASRAVS